MLCGWSKSSGAVRSLVEDDIVYERPGLREVNNNSNLEGYPGLKVVIPIIAGQSPERPGTRH